MAAAQKTYKINILFFDLEKPLSAAPAAPADKDVIQIDLPPGGGASTPTFYRLTKHYDNIEITDDETKIDQFKNELDPLPPLPPLPPLRFFAVSFLESLKKKRM